MKYSSIFKIFVVVILLIVLGFSVQKLATLRDGIDLSDFGYSTTVELPVVTVIDTQIVIKKVYVKVEVPGEIIYLPADSTGVKDSLAVYRWEPDLEHLSGYLDIRYNINRNKYKLDVHLEVTDNIIYKEITKPVVLPPKLFRLSISGGYYKSVEGGAVALGVGVTLVNKLSIHASALSNEMIGVMLLYNFGM